jgi:polyphosphate kinase 2 (PPK2 family)
VTAADIAELLKTYRVCNGRDFKLKHFSPDDQGGRKIDKAAADKLLADGVARLSDLQIRLYAQDRWAFLASFQAMDAAGKDGTIKHVMTGVNPQGVQVASFKQPGPEALDHDFMWRIHQAVPPRGRIGIFNRSHYEEVLICRVHPELIDKQMLPHAADLHERAYWDAYQDAYEAAIQGTATPHAPWYVVPADHKWFTHLIVVEAMIAVLEGLDLKAPVAPPAQVAELEAARAALEAE